MKDVVEYCEDPNWEEVVSKSNPACDDVPDIDAYIKELSEKEIEIYEGCPIYLPPVEER